MLPGYNCGQCGHWQCRDYAEEILKIGDLSKCPYLDPGDILRYRPLGCPVIHFAEVMKFNNGIATVHLAGPHQLMGAADFRYKDLGICMVTGFEGSVNKGRVPSVGETVKFLPSHCRMHQIHSGVVVHSEGNRLRIEGIDLKVWR